VRLQPDLDRCPCPWSVQGWSPALG
jgi:hypothetical protein